MKISGVQRLLHVTHSRFRFRLAIGLLARKSLLSFAQPICARDYGCHKNFQKALVFRVATTRERRNRRSGEDPY